MTDTDKMNEGGDENSEIRGDHIVVGEISNVLGIAIGSGAKSVVTTEKELREMQYEIALNWDGKRLLRGFDLSDRDLSGLDLANVDLRRADLISADLSKTNLSNSNLSEADLSGANLTETNLSDANMAGADLGEAVLTGATYTADTIWPNGFEPEKAGAVPITRKKSIWERLFG